MKKLLLPIALIILSCSAEDSCEPTPKLTTAEADNITDVSATISGTITPPTCDDTVTSQGFVYGEENLPTIDDTKIVKSGSSISASLTNLKQNTTYYIRTFFENPTGVFYGNEVMFSTNMGDAIIQTSAVSNITDTSALVGADIISDGGGTIISKGFYFSTEANPTANDQKVDGDYEGSSRFVASIQNLNSNTEYYVKAYAENESGIFYGNEVVFNTDVGDAIIQTRATAFIMDTSILVAADIISDGGGTIISKGFYFSTEANPTANDQKVDGDYEGSSRFVASIQNLNSNTEYYVKAYAENESGIFYGEERTFKTDERYPDGTATDQDGNEFGWINYGTQDWAIENAEVVTNRYGTEIPQVTNPTQWSNLKTGAWCYIDNDPSKGKLYNWYAISDWTIAPQGWRVPSNEDWETLINYLIANGYNYDGTTTGSKIGKAMASTTGWKESSQEGRPGNDQNLNNRSGFNAHALSNRSISGTMEKSGYSANFWSTTEYYSDYAWSANLFYGNVSLFRYDMNKKNLGYSLRFVRDAN